MAAGLVVGNHEHMSSHSPIHLSTSWLLARRGQRGFTLVELMVTVAIIGILVAIAMPVQKTYVIRANKAGAKAVLEEIAQRQEQFIMQNRAYASSFSALGMETPTDISNYYDFAIDLTAATTATNAALSGMPTFTASAVPKAGTVQAGEATLSINQFGLRMPVSQW